MVNTFIPYSNFRKVAKVLDWKRLGKQRVEAKQIINILDNKTDTKGWRSHPVVKMWVGYVDALKYYYNIIVAEWIKRGYQNNMPFYKLPNKVKMPWFVKCKAINYSHQASLIRKYPEYYSKIFNPPEVYMKYSYIWISHLKPEVLKCLKKEKDDIVDISKYAKLFSETAVGKAKK
jgi:hypothetical protein